MKEVSIIITKEWNEEVIIHSTKKATTNYRTNYYKRSKKKRMD